MQPLRSIRARVRSLGPARVDALIAVLFVAEGALEWALLYPDAEYGWIAMLATLSLGAALALSAMPDSSAAWTSTSKPTRRPASLPETRARLPVSSRSPSRSSTSKGTGAQRDAASGSVSTSSTAAGWADAVVVAVHVLMTATVPSAASRVVGLSDDLARPLG